jgi:hypothetical protein
VNFIRRDKMSAVKQHQIEEADREAFKEEMKEMIDCYPDLSYFGWDYAGSRHPDFEGSRAELYGKVDEVRAVMNYLAFSSAPKGAKGFGSYGFKHDVERWAERVYGKHQYIANGSGILGALMAGYLPKRHKESPNCGFKKFVLKGASHAIRQQA